MTAAACLGATSPASASMNQCPDGYFCMWSGPDYTGEFLTASDDIDFLGDPPMDMNDKVSSVWNRSDDIVSVYADAYKQGLHVTLGPGDVVPNFSQLPADLDNTASSVDYWINGVPG